MREDCKQLKGFIDAIAKNPRDVDTRLIFADWLEEHDEPELAAEQRAFSLERYDAEQRLRKFCDENSAEYEDFVAGCASGEGYCFGTDFYDELDAEIWDDIEIVSGKVFDIDHRDQTGFSCAC